MADNQQEKIIRFLKGIFKSMEEVSKKMDMSRANLYIKFKEVPLDEDFVLKAKDRLQIDLNTLSNIETKNLPANKQPETLNEENKRLRDELNEVRKELAAAQKEYIELLKKINKPTS